VNRPIPGQRPPPKKIKTTGRALPVVLEVYHKVCAAKLARPHYLYNVKIIVQILTVYGQDKVLRRTMREAAQLEQLRRIMPIIACARMWNTDC
jgi:hypothetical protein